MTGHGDSGVALRDMQWVPGGRVKAEGPGDGFAYAHKTIAKLRLTMPPGCLYRAAKNMIAVDKIQEK